MRLTLRTMLAYLDNVLEPADAEVLGKKINDSDFARGLAQRIGTVTRKVRIDAPRLDGKGMGNDPNTVAEYLDSTLPQDRVGDFERICLESDKHLCEVAACHQILALVLGKPASVPMELRERVYALGHPEAAESAPPIPTETTPKEDVAPPPVTTGNGKSQERSAPLVVPDYLKAGRRSNVWPLVAAAAIALLVVVGVLRAMGPFDRTHPIARLIGAAPVEVAQRPEETNPTDLEPPTIVTPDPDANSEEESPVAPGPADEGTVERQAPDRAAADSEATPAADTGTDRAPSVEADMPPAVSSDEGDAAAPDRPAIPRVADVAADAAGDRDPSAAPAPAAPGDAADTTAPDITEPDAVAVAPLPGEGPPTIEPGELPADEPMDVGRYTSEAQLLSAMDEGSRLWYAKAPRSVLMAGERLASLPPYRPQVALPSGVQVTFVGESVVRMGRPAESGASHMAVDWGRFVIVTVGAAGAQVDLNLVGLKGLLTLVDADSSVALRVGRWLPPGTDPEAVGSARVVEIFSTHGRVTWHEEGEEKITIPPNHVHVYLGTNPPETLGQFEPPEWIDARSIAPIDRQAAIVLEGLLPPDKPLNLSLLEAMQDRRVEVRALAARCLAFLGDFEPILRQLADSRQYSFWAGQVASLQEAVAAGPESAAVLRATIDRVRPADARELYRLTWGYSQEQLEKSAAAQLVKLLEHEAMDVRVLAFYNLVAITGAQEFYRPEREPSSQRAAIQNWKQRLEKGTISWKTTPSPIWPYKPLAETTATSSVPTPPRSPLEMPLDAEL